MNKDIYVYRIWDNNRKEFLTGRSKRTVWMNRGSASRVIIERFWKQDGFVIKKYKLVEVEDEHKDDN